MRVGKKAVALIGLVLFALILANINLAKVLATISGINPVVYAASLLVLFLLLCLKGVKWKIILACQGKNISLLESIRFYLIGLFVGNVTPGKIGDFARAMYLKEKTGLPLGLASVVLDRFMDVGILVVFSVLSTFSFAYLYGVTVIPPHVFVLVLLAFSAALFFLVKEKYLKMFLRPVFNFVVPESQKQRISMGFAEFFSSVKAVKQNLPLFGVSVVVGVMIWLIGAFVFYMLSLSLSIGLPLHVILLVFPLVSLTDLLPVSFSGLGTREAALIFLLSFFSVGAESAVALSLLVFFTGYALVSFVGLLLFLRDPVKLDSFA